MWVTITIERTNDDGETIEQEVEVHLRYQRGSLRTWEDPGEDELWEVEEMFPVVDLTEGEVEAAAALARDQAIGGWLSGDNW